MHLERRPVPRRIVPAPYWLVRSTVLVATSRDSRVGSVPNGTQLVPLRFQNVSEFLVSIDHSSTQLRQFRERVTIRSSTPILTMNGRHSQGTSRDPMRASTALLSGSASVCHASTTRANSESAGVPVSQPAETMGQWRRNRGFHLDNREGSTVCGSVIVGSTPTGAFLKPPLELHVSTGVFIFRLDRRRPSLCFSSSGTQAFTAIPSQYQRISPLLRR